MTKLIKILLSLLFILLYSFSYGQMDTYKYQRELKGVTEKWHKIVLPNEVLEKVSQNLSDIRIFGLTENKDTIETPYLLRMAMEKKESKKVKFKTLNISHNYKGSYYTFEVPTQEPINEILLNFKQNNFDWQVSLEGSQNQEEWFTLIKNYRILSIKNEETNFQFTRLSFPNSKYRFFRVFINSKSKPILTDATITQNKFTKSTYQHYSPKNINIQENKQSKQTEIDVDFEFPIRLSDINVVVSNNFNYYRPITIKYLKDSVKTEQGWIYNYQTLIHGALNSSEKNEFYFNSILVKKLKIWIDNNNNQPLKIRTIKAKGYTYELLARFTEQATYFLTYGNKNTHKPNYDIERFTNDIPKKLTSLEIGNEQIILQKETTPTANPLFENKIWLWIIMILIIVTLGGFSIKMMQKK